MSLFKKLFANSIPKKQCPRCLGKGHVDLDDIKRMNMQLRWRPGKCAYCNGVGEIDMTIDKNVPVDMAYLTSEIGEDERTRIIIKDKGALKRAQIHDAEIEKSISQLWYLYTVGKLNVDQIVEFYFMSAPKDSQTDKERLELAKHIEKIIQEKNK